MVWQKLDSRFFSFFSQLVFSLFPFFWERIHGIYTLLPSIPLKVYMTDMVPVRKLTTVLLDADPSSAATRRHNADASPESGRLSSHSTHRPIMSYTN